MSSITLPLSGHMIVCPYPPGISHFIAEDYLVAGQGAYALSFPWSAWVELPVSVSTAATNEFSIEAWFKITVSNTTGVNPGPWSIVSPTNALSRPLFSRYNTSSSATDEDNGFFLQVTPQGYLGDV